MTLRNHELRFLLAAAGIAAATGFVGSLMLGIHGSRAFNAVIVLLSILFWVPMAFWISRGRRSAGIAFGLGAMSPFLVALVAFPPWSFAILSGHLVASLAIGAMTGGLIFLLSRSSWRVVSRAA